MKLQPMGKRVIVRPDELPEMTASGIFIPEMAREPCRSGVVTASDFEDVEEGDKVLFPEYGPSRILVDGVEHFILREPDLHAKVV